MDASGESSRALLLHLSVISMTSLQGVNSQVQLLQLIIILIILLIYIHAQAGTYLYSVGL